MGSEESVAKPEWGTKRLCLNCGARFYDLRRDPIVCPRCDTVFVPEPPARARRGATQAKATAAAPEAVEAVAPVEAAEVVEAVVADEDDPEIAELVVEAEIDVEVDSDDDEDDALIEDASELGEDEDDVAEVLDGTIETEEEDR